MTTRKPLVVVAGQVRQLASGDSLEGVGEYPALLTELPANPTVGQRIRYIGSWNNEVYVWDGTYWRGEQLLTIPFGVWGTAPPFGGNGGYLVAPLQGRYYLLRGRLSYRINTPNNSTNYWTLNLTNGAGTTFVNTNTMYGSANINSLWQINQHGYIEPGSLVAIEIAKTGSPGSIMMSGYLMVNAAL